MVRYKRLQPLLEVLCFSLNSDRVPGGWWWKMTSPCPLIPREENSQLLLLGRPSQKSEQSPLLCPRLSSDLCPNLPFLGPLACLAPQFCVLTPARGSDSKLQILKASARRGPALLSQRRALQHCAWHHSVPEKQSYAVHMVAGVYGEEQRQAEDKLSALCTSLCSLPLNHCSMSLGGPFVLAEAIHPLPNVLQKGE